MKPKEKACLLKKAQSLTLTIGRLLQKEAAAGWNSRNQQRLHDAQKAMDVVEACITELVCQD